MKPPVNTQGENSVEEKNMMIESNRFGQIEVSEDRILEIKGGLLGFPNLSKFILLDDQQDPGLPFKWLISIEDPEYGFLVTDPGIFFNDYVFDLSEEHRKLLDIQNEDDVSVVTMLTIPSDPKMITTNLRGPIVVNSRTLVGTQIVLSNTNYATKHYVFLEATHQGDEALKEATEDLLQEDFVAAAKEQIASNSNTDVTRES